MEKNLRRIFIERGLDFFDKDVTNRAAPEQLPDEPEAETSKEEASGLQPMTPEDLFKMRAELMPQLQ